jgi:hypothetical protein
MPERSSGEVFLEILDSWPRLGKLVLLIFATSAVVCVLAYEVLQHLPSNASELQLGATDSSHVVIRQPTKGGGSSAVIVVAPQGWNQTSIQVREGEFYAINAGGRIQTSLYDLNLALEARRKAEDRIDKAHASGSVYKPLYRGGETGDGARLALVRPRRRDSGGNEASESRVTEETLPDDPAVWPFDRGFQQYRL